MKAYRRTILLVAIVGSLALSCAQAQELEELPDVATNVLSAGPKASVRHWGTPATTTTPLFEDVQLLVLGRTKHTGMSPYLNDHNPGLALRISVGSCLWDFFKCHVAGLFIDENSVRGNTWTLGAGVKKEFFAQGPWTATAGLEVFVMGYQYPPRNENYTAPGASFFVEGAYQIDKHTSLGIGTFIIPAGHGKRGTKRVETRYLTLIQKF
jgi:hypothetical protein